MAWQRHWVIRSREQWAQVTNALAGFSVDFERHHIELIMREPRKQKSGEQRALFHAICGDLAPLIHETPRATKLRIKADFYGVTVVDTDGVIVAVVPSSEDSDREEYSRLIDHAYQYAAEAGVFLPDRRPT